MKLVFSRPLITILAIAIMALPSTQAQDRIVSLGGDVTEIIYALGEGDRIVATDSTSVYPLAALTTKKVGYVRRLSAEGVLSVEPDLILISGAAGPEAALVQLRDTGVQMVEMKTEYTIDAVVEKARIVSEVLGVPEKGEAVIADIQADWYEAEAEIEALDMNPSVLFFSTLNDGTPTAAGTETAAHGIIEMLGGTNAFAQRTGYKPLSLEAAVAADPDIILVMNHVAGRMGSVEAVTEHPAISLTNAARNGLIFSVDAVQVMQFSPRTPQATAKLARDIKSKLDGSDGS